MSSRQVTIRPAAAGLAGLAVVFELVGDPDAAGGVGGWSPIDRPRRSAAVEWLGTPARTQTLPVLLNGLEVAPGVDLSIEPQLGAIVAWGEPAQVTDDQPPPLILAGPIPFTDGQWVLDDITWGAMTRDAAGRRTQQYLTLAFTEYLTTQILKSPAKKARHHHKKH